MIRYRRRSKPRRGPADIPAEEWRNPGYRAFLREEGRCVACIREHEIVSGESWSEVNRFSKNALAPQGVCDPAHGPVNGTSSKGPDSGCIPLCRYHHDQQTTIGWVRFQVLHNFDRAKEALVWWAAYLIWKEDTGAC